MPLSFPSTSRDGETTKPSRFTIPPMLQWILAIIVWSATPTELPSAQDNQKVSLSGTLAANSVVVVVLDKQDPDGVGYEAPVWDELAEAADLWVCPVYDENNMMYFNGNEPNGVIRKKWGQAGRGPCTTSTHLVHHSPTHSTHSCFARFRATLSLTSLVQLATILARPFNQIRREVGPRHDTESYLDSQVKRDRRRH